MAANAMAADAEWHKVEADRLDVLATEALRLQDGKECARVAAEKKARAKGRASAEQHRQHDQHTGKKPSRPAVPLKSGPKVRADRAVPKPKPAAKPKVKAVKVVKPRAVKQKVEKCNDDTVFLQVAYAVVVHCDCTSRSQPFCR